jgi:hypothetical protein
MSTCQKVKSIKTSTTAFGSFYVWVGFDKLTFGRSTISPGIPTLCMDKL